MITKGMVDYAGGNELHNVYNPKEVVFHVRFYLDVIDVMLLVKFQG